MSEALAAIVKYAFQTMDMHRIYAKTDRENASSIAMLRRLGFIQEGILRQETARDGAWCDTAIMAILKSDIA
jgi:ribosomal-protein-alanine N-acetyltransferase